MKPDSEHLLKALPEALPPSFSLVRVAGWVRTGRKRKRFHVMAWLGRVLRFPLS